MNKKINEIITIIKEPFFLVLLTSLISILSIIQYVPTKIEIPPIGIPTEEAITPIEDQKIHELEIKGPLLISGDNFDISKYPLISINNKITGGLIEFNLEPNSKLKKYQYLNSVSYFFAFRFFFGSINNGGYYQVFRNDLGGVQNDISRGLNGAVSGADFKDGHVWTIPLSNKVIFAQEKGQFGYKELDLLSYFNSNIGKTVSIGGFISSIKEEPNGWNLTQINSIKIKYTGDKDAITLK